MGTAETIGVVNVPVNVEAKFTAIDSCHLCRGHRASAARVVMSRPVGRDYATRYGVVLDHRPFEGKAFRERPPFQSDPANPHDVVGRGQAQVLDVNLDLDCVISGWVPDKCHFFLRVEKDIGPQLSSGSVLSPQNQPSGSSPKEDCREAKDGRESRYDYGAEGDPKFVVRLEKINKPDEPGFGWLIAGLGFIFVPAAAVIVGGLSRNRFVLWASLGALGCRTFGVFALMVGALG